MKRFFKRTLLLCFFSFFVFCMPSMVKAGDPGGPGSPVDPACDPQCNCYPDPPYNPCPIDSYIYILLATGAGYGIKKYRDATKEKPDTVS